MTFEIVSIGVIHSPHLNAAGTPVQAAFAAACTGTVEVDPAYAAGLADLDGFERLWLIYWFHRARRAELIVTPFLDTRPHGIFATRSPRRPNPIGLSSVRLLRREGTTLHVGDLDILDGTPLIDIKPYVPAFDCFQVERVGWCADRPHELGTHADGRFSL